MSRAARARRCLLALAVFAAPALAAAGDGAAPLARHVFTPRHQSAGNALPLVHPLLSSRGTVELRRADNTLVIEDVASSLPAVVEALAAYDRPARLMRLRVQLVQALARAGEGDGAQALPPELLERLRRLLRFESYSLVASADVGVSEGVAAAFELHPDYRLDFQLVDSGDRQAELRDFKILRRAADRELETLLHTHLKMALDQPMVLGLARSEASDSALMVVLRCDAAPAPREGG